MQTVRPAIANDPRTFGRRMQPAQAIAAPTPVLSDDFRLFAMTFLAGFVFVSVLLA